MKKITIACRIITALFAAFMLFTAIPNIMMVNASVELIAGLDYPKYFIPFIGVAKVNGSVAILFMA
ncbi:hypothetical protein FRZ67_05455 [Panacibacter ginsenosidivorans]|uniref:DoxX family protein n=1 Tax=Panacibacter ginsenosidivorans TaxID=1813871 RepID=A0A5B8V6N0_9BACT|nr:DoxX family protein [Panacibacter ginsenosidivorans]QEC66775.1 hypothetical protein FRZ67_05455 [Panacibacter ginsenosidivorans]